MNKRVLFILCLLITLCLVGCKKDAETVETSAIKVTEEETKDPFAVEHDFNLGETEAEEETTEDAEAQEIADTQNLYVYTDDTGKDVDMRDVYGYAGMLSYVSEKGGIEALKATPQAELEEYVRGVFFLATEEEIDSVIDSVYGEDSEQKEQIEEDMEEQSKADSGLVYTDEGWKDVYSETNGGSGGSIFSEDELGGYSPMDPALEGITVYGY